MIGGATRAGAHYQGRALQKLARPGNTDPGGRWRQRLLQSTRVTGLTLGITLASVAAPVIGEVVVNSPLLAVRGIEVKGTHTLTAAQVQRMAGLTIGMPVIEVSPRAATAALQRSPRVASATVERSWNGFVRIVISERHGVALLSTAFDDSASAPLVVAEDGMLLDPCGPAENTELPFVTGLAQPRMRAGDRLPAARFHAVAQLLAIMRRPDVALTPQVSSVDLAGGDSLWLTILQSGSRVLLPQRLLTVEDLVTLRGILEDCERQHLPAQVINMSFKDMVVLDPADPQALRRQAREHQDEELQLAAAARARVAAADSLAHYAALSEASADSTQLALAQRGRYDRRGAGGPTSLRLPGPTRDPQRGPRHAGHLRTSRPRSVADGRTSTTSHRSLPPW